MCFNKYYYLLKNKSLSSREKIMSQKILYNNYFNLKLLSILLIPILLQYYYHEFN